MLIGKRINDRYKILEMVGGGGMANVYLAHDVILDRDVAIKILRLDFANDEEFIRRFNREAQSATSLAHPNIVSIYDVGEEDSIYYIVMEYVDGQTLKQYIQQHAPLRVEETIQIMQQLTSAISHAHQNHIIHRDIKPHNILVDRKGNVKITDFGIAMALSATSITQTNSVLGSVHYLSPEQARGGMANRKSDIYSLGIVMFEMLSGRLPFSGESAVSIALKHLQSETPSLRRWNPNIPQSVENIVLKATAKDPFHRYESVEAMEEDLNTSLDTSRMNEEKFTIPIDDDVTKAIPVITNEHAFQKLDETIIHNKEKQETKLEAKSADQKNGKKGKKRKKWPFILVSVFAFLFILGILTVTVLPDLLSPKEIEVPDINGLEINEAKLKLKDLGFHIGETHELNDENVAEGLVIKTNPKEGKLIKEGSEIDLYVSSGKEKFELDDYRKQNYNDVLRLLENKNFINIIPKEEYSEDVEQGVILDQSPQAGKMVVPEDTVLEFTISKGSKPIFLRDLKGYNEKGVQDYADSFGLNIEFGKEQYDETVEKGQVISQHPAPGTQLKKGAKVTVVLSKGKESIPPEKVTREITIPYEPEEEGEPQEVQILIEDMNRSMTEPAKVFTITKTVTRTIELLIPHGGRAGYKVVRDSKVIIDEVVLSQNDGD